MDMPKPTRVTARTEALELLSNMTREWFVYAATRALFVEFVTFNANEVRMVAFMFVFGECQCWVQQNYFVVGTLLFEFPRTGGIITSSDFSIVKLDRYVTDGDMKVCPCVCVWYQPP